MSREHRVELTWEEDRSERLLVAPDETVLEAADRVDLTLPESCRWGACGQCLAWLVAGEMEYTDTPHVLAKRGYSQGGTVSADSDRIRVLLCLAQPRTECRIRIDPTLYHDI
jgi:ferredoxin